MNTRIARGLYFALQRLRREPVEQALADVRKSERMSLDELLAIQHRRQREQLLFALDHVPHYRERYRACQARITASRNWDETNDVLSALPVTEKLEVSSAPDRFTADNLHDLSTHLDKTSGSSGSPLIFPCDQLAWAYRHAITFRCAESFGVAIGEPYALFFGLHWNKKTRAEVALRDRVFNRTRISAYDIGRVRLDEHLRQLRNARPTHFWGYPSAIYEFCSLVKERGYDLRSLGLKAIFVTAEPCRVHQRLLIEEVTGSRCVDTYGSAEGGLCAFECPAGSLHLAVEATWTTLRDPGHDSGELVVTDLFLRAFPMIRYAIGDDAVLKRGTCACGRAHPMLASIEGRSGEPIELPNGRRINANLPSYIFKPLARLGVIHRYRFVQRGSQLELLLVVSTKFSPEHRAIVQRETRAAFGEVDLAVRIVDALPHLANAKHRDYIRVDA